MLIRPKVLSFITTSQCTASCKNCCFSCSPKETNAIPVPRMHEYIDQACEVGSIRVIVFTGGECFLLGNDLDCLISHAARNGFSTRFVSNGYWATSPKVAQKRVKDIVSAGVKEANFSTGESHANFVSPEYVKYGAIACAEEGLPTIIALELFKGEKFDLNLFLSDAKFKSLIEDKRIIIQTSPWVSFSNNCEQDSTISYSKEYLAFVAKSDRSCRSSLYTIAISFHEDLWACCGLTSMAIPEWSLGSLKNQTIEDAINAAPDDLLKLWIHFEGPEAVLNYINQVAPDFKLRFGFAHVCDACRYLYSRGKIVLDVIRTNPPPQFSFMLNRWCMQLLISESQEHREGGVRDDGKSLRLLKSRFSIKNVFSLKSLVSEDSFQP